MTAVDVDPVEPTAVEPAKPAPPPPPPPPPRSGVTAPNPSSTVPTVRPKGFKPSGLKVVGLGAAAVLFLIFGVMVLMGGGSSSAPKDPIAPGVDELIETSPLLWWPPLTRPMKAFVGDSRAAQEVFARKVNDMIKDGVNPCDVWATKTTYIEITFQRRWTVDYPVPAFECPRSEIGTYIPPPSAGGTAPAAPGATPTTKPAAKGE